MHLRFRLLVFYRGPVHLFTRLFHQRAGAGDGLAANPGAASLQPHAMGCGASAATGGGADLRRSQTAARGTSASYKSEEGTQRGSVRDGGDGGGSRGYWERQKLVASKWTVNSTMSIAKAAMENGMPEPPQSYFETQDRLVRFFQDNGELKIFEPNEVCDSKFTAAKAHRRFTRNSPASTFTGGHRSGRRPRGALHCRGGR